MSLSGQRSMLPWLALSAVILVLDLVTKSLASSHLDYALPVNVIPGFFNLTLLHNTGAAFSFLATESGWQRWFFIALASLVSLALIKWLQTLQGDRWMAIAITLILGGALGNLYDRITLGYVVDFLHFFWNDYHFPAFNIADTAISIGAAMMILDLFRKHEDQEETESPRSE